MTSLDILARQVSLHGLVLAYSRSGYATLAFRYPGLAGDLRQALRNHRCGLARLMREGDIRVCPARDLHRASWYYAGQGRYVCPVCRCIDAQLGMWQKVS